MATTTADTTVTWTTAPSTATDASGLGAFFSLCFQISFETVKIS
jgi:hypothetical protein